MINFFSSPKRIITVAVIVLLLPFLLKIGYYIFLFLLALLILPFLVIRKDTFQDHLKRMMYKENPGTSFDTHDDVIDVDAKRR